MSKGRLWVLALLIVSLLELLVIGYAQVAAQQAQQATATPAAAATAQPAGPGSPLESGTVPVTPSAIDQARPLFSRDVAPSGYTTDDAKAYYDYLYANYLDQRANQATGIRWSGPLWILLTAGVLIGFFYLYASRFQNVHRGHGELYGLTSFAGAILERIGRISVFNKLVWTGTVLLALYYIVTHILFGQIY